MKNIVMTILCIMLLVVYVLLIIINQEVSKKINSLNSEMLHTRFQMEANLFYCQQRMIVIENKQKKLQKDIDGAFIIKPVSQNRRPRIYTDPKLGDIMEF